jgi:hypothetical protein
MSLDWISTADRLKSYRPMLQVSFARLDELTHELSRSDRDLGMGNPESYPRSCGDRGRGTEPPIQDVKKSWLSLSFEGSEPPITNGNERQYNVLF